jgi:hypothetical protein
MKTLSLTILAALAFFPAANPLFGEVIVSDTLGGSTGSENAFLAVSWTQTGTFDNVSIKAGLESNLPTLSSGTAYLSDKLGSGAMSADVLYTFAVSTNNNTPSTMISLFSGLTLGPGTYYLSINPGSGLFWVESGTPEPSMIGFLSAGLGLVVFARRLRNRSQTV